MCTIDADLFRKSKLCVPMLMLAISWAAMDKTVAQDVSHLPPEKARVVLEFRGNRDTIPCVTAGKGLNTRELRAQYIENEMLGNLDPILIGRNIIFSKSYLDIVGNGKPLTRQQFEAFRNRLDLVYDAYEDLIGLNPRIIYLNLMPAASSSFSGELGHAHNNHINGSALICINADSFRSHLTNIARLNSTHRTSMHEMGHSFENLLPQHDDETMAELLIAYALEKTGVHFVTVGQERQVIRGDMHRQRTYDASYRAFLRGNIPAISANMGSSSAYRMYLFGLVDKVGWDAYKKAFHSYPKVGYPEVGIHIPREQDRPPNFHLLSYKARDLLDRIEYFSGKPGVLRSLPDGGRLLDQHFNYQIEHKPYLMLDPRTGQPKDGVELPPTPRFFRITTPRQTAQQPTVTPQQSTIAPQQLQAGSRLATPTIQQGTTTGSSRVQTPGARSFVNEELEILNRSAH